MQNKRPRKWRIWLGLLAFLIGLADYLLLRALGVQMFLNQQDVTLSVTAYFAVSFGIFGFLIGALLETRRALQDSQQTIQQQLVELETTQKLAAENEKLATVGRLAACVAHEVRNPLGVIRTSASLLLEDMDETDNNYRAGEFILEEVDRLNRFCTALLHYARPIQLTPTATDVRELMEYLEQMCYALRASHHIEVSTHCPDTLPQVTLDQDLIKQAFQSLIQNALQEMPEAGKLELRARAEKDHVTLELADTGTGIPEELTSKVFEPFFTTKAEGTGLGLAMVQKVIEAHSGSISILSQQGAGPNGQGACFRIQLPYLHG